ncbi:unnamed protein product (macronuclear) [Paramecium tetraurelia]|uniref:Transmembrane protein n=1 Tax=Paramecium tetraurelia TaxID=5888 RepID=A0DLB5_PARTE|nr:uncharacterized protein GSPATT00018149001 [Paramecium tetraurelia]CAK83832.1 unnamed protein product [Paramecium tetraurelia]|eukprot:XP_001451229.1 hypothetical protein (macronuclear) [Paramecium tetraurelia strain d4-2]
MFFLLLYGVIFLALSLLMIGLFEYNCMFYLFEWIWLWFFGMILSMVFLIKEESINEEDREQLLEKEISEHKQTYIPFTMYAINASIQAADILLICFELFYMSFGLFIICQGIVFVFYIIYTNKYDQLKLIYGGVVLLTGIFSLALDTDGNDKCYIGLIATLLQIGTNIYTIKLKEEFMCQYIFQHSKYISYTGLLKFLMWVIVIVIVNFIPCPKVDKTTVCPNNQYSDKKCSANGNLGDFSGYFETTFSEEYNQNQQKSITYPVIVFVVLILVSSAISYMDNKITIKQQSDKKQIIQQFVFFPLQIWVYHSHLNTTLFVFCILFFILQWLLGLYIIFQDKKTAKYEQIEEDQDSEFS